MKTFKTFAILSLIATFTFGPVSSAWASREYRHHRHYSHHSHRSHSGDVWASAVGGTMLGLMLSRAAQPAKPAQPKVVVIQQQPPVRPRAWASSFDPETGRTTTASYNANGDVEIVVTDSNGNVISRRVRDKRVGASSYDPETGTTTSSYRNANGDVEITETDRNGNTTRRTRDNRVGGSSYDPETGRTTSSYRQADGSVQVTVTDSNGNVIDQWSR